MNRFISSAMMALLAVVVLPRINTVFYYDRLINVTQRVLDGTIQADVHRVQYSSIQSADAVANKVSRNMKALKKHAACATNPTTCKSVSAK